jgi:hypothetical protein
MGLFEESDSDVTRPRFEPCTQEGDVASTCFTSWFSTVGPTSAISWNGTLKQATDVASSKAGTDTVSRAEICRKSAHMFIALLLAAPDHRLTAVGASAKRLEWISIIKTHATGSNEVRGMKPSTRDDRKG